VTRQFRVGLVGAGYVAEFHVKALRRLPQVQLVGVTDLDPERARAFAKQFGIATTYPSLEAMAKAGLDVVHVLTPPHAHAQVGLEAMELGCHVLIEKPLATSVEDCDRLIATAQRLGRVAGVNHSFLGDPRLRRALDAVHAGAVGDIVSVDIFWSDVYPEYRGGSLPPRYRDGGYPFRDLGIHALYLLRAFLGEIRGVHGDFSSRGGDPNLYADEWRCLVQCEKGTGGIQLSWNIRPLQFYATIHGTKGSIRVDFAQMYITRRHSTFLPSAIERIVNALAESLPLLGQVSVNVAQFVTGRLKPYQGLHNFVQQFYECLGADIPLPATLEDGREVVRWNEEVARPADNGKMTRSNRFRGGAEPVVLVTGGRGFVGRHLVRRLLQEHKHIRLFLRRAPDPEFLENPRVEIVLGDLGDPDAVDCAVRGATLVYHLGAAMGGGWSEHESATIAGTQNIVDSCVKHNVPKLVHMSSLSVIDWAGSKEGSPCTEDCPLEPRPEVRGFYTQAKLAAELVVLRAVRERKLPAVIVRPGLIFGPDGPIAAASGALVAGGKLLVLGAGNARLPLVYVEDVIDALILAARSNRFDGSIFHVVDDAAITQKDMAKMVGKARGMQVLRVPQPLVFSLALALEIVGRLLGRNVPLTRYRLRSSQADIAFDCTKIRQELGWNPKVGVNNGLRLVLER